MSRQKLNLLWLMIVCCASRQITCSENLEIQVLTDGCFWNSSSSINQAINLTCQSDDGNKSVHVMNVKLNISSLGQCKTYNFSITKQGDQYGVRINEIKDKGCLENPPVNPEERCRNATYNDHACREEESSTYIMRLNNTEWTCVTCNNSGTSASEEDENDTPETHEKTFDIELAGLEDEDGDVDSSIASDVLDYLDTVIEQMEENNTRCAGLVAGKAIGVLQIKANTTETKETCYSSYQNIINVADCQRILSRNLSWYVKISKEAFNKSRLENNGTAFLGVLRFNNMGDKNQTLNNEVYGITMRANISDLTNNIEMFFKQNDLVGNASCSSWDGKGNLTWTTSGCETVKINNNTIKCSCSHLTFFAVLMSPPDINANSTALYVESLSFITSIGCGISMFFQAVALFMHFLLRKAKSNQATKILMNMFVALFLLNLSFLSNESVANTGDKAACVFIALLMHYSMLTTFTWFFIQALHMYLWLIRQNVTITNYMRKITVFGWTFPAPIVVAVVSIGGYKTITISATSGKTQMCWITDPLIHYIVNIGYYALVFIFTTGIFIMIITKIVQARHIRVADGKIKTFRKQLMIVLSLFLLFGLTWAVAFFSYGEMLIPSYYIFTVLNSFQGFFLFLYYYNIHKDIEGNFSDDPERSGSTTTIVQSNAVENVYN